MGVDYRRFVGNRTRSSRQLAKAGLNTVLAAQRRALLQEAGASLARDFGVQYRVITADFSEEGFVETLANSTDDLDIGLVVSNAGPPVPVGFFRQTGMNSPADCASTRYRTGYRSSFRQEAPHAAEAV